MIASLNRRCTHVASRDSGAWSRPTFVARPPPASRAARPSGRVKPEPQRCTVGFFKSYFKVIKVHKMTSGLRVLHVKTESLIVRSVRPRLFRFDSVISSRYAYSNPRLGVSYLLFRIFDREPYTRPRPTHVDSKLTSLELRCAIHYMYAEMDLNLFLPYGKSSNGK